MKYESKGIDEKVSARGRRKKTHWLIYLEFINKYNKNNIWKKKKRGYKIHFYQY